MMFKTKITRKWEVVIPKAMLDNVGISPGEEIVMAYEGGELVIRKA